MEQGVRRNVGLVKVSRLDYGGRNSTLVVMVPMMVLGLLGLLGYAMGVHGSGWEGMWIWTAGTILGVITFSIAGVWEYAGMGTVIFSASGLECVAWLVLFEVCFFGGVGWSLGIVRVHSMAEVGLRAVDMWTGSSDLDFGLWFDSGIVHYASSSLMIGESCLPCMISLVILLLVTLLLQLIHRYAIVWCLFRSSSGKSFVEFFGS